MTKKSSCCHASIRRFGGKRRQCSKCLKTWSIRPSKRGPKIIRTNHEHLRKVLAKGYLVKNLARKNISEDAIYKRFSHNLEKATRRLRKITVRPGTLILISDAKWYSFKKARWTLYVIGVKPCNQSRIEILDPVLRPGKENTTEWRQVIEANISDELKKQIKSVVSDGIRGIEGVAKDYGWILQRCHFHLLSMIQKQRGKRASTKGRKAREAIYQTVKKVLKTNDPKIVFQSILKLRRHTNASGCPKRLKYTVNGFIRRIDDYHSYLNYPELNIPTTTNVIESVNSKIKSRTAKIKTPKALRKWAVAVIRNHKYFNCK